MIQFDGRHAGSEFPDTTQCKACVLGWSFSTNAYPAPEHLEAEQSRQIPSKGFSSFAFEANPKLEARPSPSGQEQVTSRFGT